MQQLLRIFERERYDMVIWDGDRAGDEAYVALLPSIATALPEAKLQAGKRASDAKPMKEEWNNFIAAKGSPMEFDVYEVPDADFEELDWFALAKILYLKFGPGDVHFFGGGELSKKQLTMLADPGEGTVYSYDVVREKNGNGRDLESSHVHTMLKNCPESQEDGEGVVKLTKVGALRENRVSGTAVVQEQVALQNPRAELPLVRPHLSEDMAQGSQLMAALNSSMEPPMNMRHMRSGGARQLRVDTVQLWSKQERRMEVRTDMGNQLTMQSEQRYEASAMVQSSAMAQSFGERCGGQTLGQQMMCNVTAEMHTVSVNVEQVSTSYCASPALRRRDATALRACGDLALRLCGTAASARST